MIVDSVSHKVLLTESFHLWHSMDAYIGRRSRYDYYHSKLILDKMHAEKTVNIHIASVDNSSILYLSLTFYGLMLTSIMNSVWFFTRAQSCVVCSPQPQIVPYEIRAMDADNDISRNDANKIGSADMSHLVYPNLTEISFHRYCFLC